MRWIPNTEDELVAGLDARTVRENHHYDLKREPDTNNKETARDFASFAIDGGVIIYGVDEVAPTDFKPYPIALTGLKERLDQVARSSIDPPLSIRTHEIPTVGGDGYLVVTIPESPEAPHMVGGKYYARSDTTKYVLSDAEVVRLHDRRAAQEEEIWSLLNHEIQRDPTIGTEFRRNAHLFIVAEPVFATGERLQKAVADPGLGRWVSTHIVGGRPRVTPASTWSPDFNELNVSPRARGVGGYTHHIGADRSVGPDARENDLLDLEILDTGGLRLFCSRASGEIGSPDRGDTRRVVFEVIVMGLAKRIVVAALEVSNAMQYLGSWDLGLAVEGLRGCVSYELSERRFGGTAVPYSADEYRRVLRVTVEDMERGVDSVVRGLTGSLNRTLNWDTVSVP
jgi:hypothetical protein